MKANFHGSRRFILGTLVTAPLISALQVCFGQYASSDTKLIEQGNRIEKLSEALETTNGHDELMACFEEMKRISLEMVATPARTLEGLAAKAKATAWALQDRIDPLKDEHSINNRLAASIVSDLLVLSKAAS